MPETTGCQVSVGEAELFRQPALAQEEMDSLEQFSSHAQFLTLLCQKHSSLEYLPQLIC